MTEKGDGSSSSVSSDSEQPEKQLQTSIKSIATIGTQTDPVAVQQVNMTL